MKHNKLSKYPRRGTCLFFMRSLISSLSFKIFCWYFSFANSRVFIWLSFSSIAEDDETTHYSSVFWNLLLSAVVLKIISHASPLHWCKYRIFVSLLAIPQASPLRWNHPFDTSGHNFLSYKRFLQYQRSFFYIPTPCALP